VKVLLLLAHQELFQSGGAAREKGQSYLVENKRSRRQGSGGVGKGVAAFEGSGTELLPGAVEKGDLGKCNGTEQRGGRDSQDMWSSLGHWRWARADQGDIYEDERREAGMKLYNQCMTQLRWVLNLFF